MSDLSTFTPPASLAGMTILQQAEGHAVTVQVGESRVVLLVDDEDFLKVNGPKDRYTVTDLMTGMDHRLRRTDCGLGCRCAVEFA